MKRMRIRMQYIITACLLIILSSNVYQIAGQYLFGQELPKFFGFTQVIVLSGSMEPTISAGDMLILREQPAYRLGDIVTYKSGQSLITHRVIGNSGLKVTTKGDANNMADDPISIYQIEGRVVLVLPGVGNWVLFLKTPMGMLLLSLGALAMIEVPYLWEQHKKKVSK